MGPSDGKLKSASRNETKFETLFLCKSFQATSSTFNIKRLSKMCLDVMFYEIKSRFFCFYFLLTVSAEGTWNLRSTIMIFMTYFRTNSTKLTTFTKVDLAPALACFLSHRLNLNCVALWLYCVNRREIVLLAVKQVAYSLPRKNAKTTRNSSNLLTTIYCSEAIFVAS